MPLLSRSLAARRYNLCPALKRCSSASSSAERPRLNDLPPSRLNPDPDDFASPNFADKAELWLHAGRGGNGCVSFLREAFLPDGPPNGGDGGAGGNVYIQAAHGETSLHKLVRRRFVRAGRGRSGQGSAKGGVRGEDVVITVPVGTIVRELERRDPAAEEAASIRAYRALQKQRRREQLALAEEKEEQEEQEEQGKHGGYVDGEEGKGKRRITTTPTTMRSRPPPSGSRGGDEAADPDPDLDDPSRHKWLLHPATSRSDRESASFPRLPRRQPLLRQPPAPIYLDLAHATPRPVLVAAGGIGGLGNPHFVSRELPKPLFATRGDDAVSVRLALELKLLADVGLVGLPNAGKSTLLRALTNSRTRVGSWAFTTLQPNVGTVVLDKYSGRPAALPPGFNHRPRSPDQPGRSPTRFTVADIPGLVDGAHLDRGLGIAFLRHVERAGVLAFVVDLSAGDAVRALDALWREVTLYAQLRDQEERLRQTQAAPHDDDDDDDDTAYPVLPSEEAPSASGPRIVAKPWFVVATKADLPQTQDNFVRLKGYLDSITSGDAKHPSGEDESWTRECAAIPVSAIHGQGVDRIIHWTLGLLYDDADAVS